MFIPHRQQSTTIDWTMNKWSLWVKNEQNTLHLELSINYQSIEEEWREGEDIVCIENGSDFIFLVAANGGR